MRDGLKRSHILGWAVYYSDGSVYRDDTPPCSLPKIGCQGTVLFCRGDIALGQSPLKVYREIDCGRNADTVWYRLPGAKCKIRASMIDDDAFETIRQAMDNDWTHGPRLD